VKSVVAKRWSIQEPHHRIEYSGLNMLTISASIWLGLTFVLIGTISVRLTLQTSASVRGVNAPTRLKAAHRIGVYLFIALVSALGYFMVTRLGDAAAGAPPSTMIHLTLAIVLSPLLFVKALGARYNKSYYSPLVPIGTGDIRTDRHAIAHVRLPIPLCVAESETLKRHIQQTLCPDHQPRWNSFDGNIQTQLPPSLSRIIRA
jgi:hypothetical protein